MPTKIIIKSNQAKLLKKKNHTQTYIYIKSKERAFFWGKDITIYIKKN